MENQQKRGVLALIGGAEDKKYAMTVLRSVYQINTPKNIIVIPTASRYGVELGDEYKVIFKNFGCPNVYVLNITDRYNIDTDKHLELTQEADLIFFTGGDQVKLCEVFNQTSMMNLIRKRHYEHQATIAGTSAGAAAASDMLIYEGSDFGFNKGSVKDAVGLGFTDITVDTHFVERNRIPRLVQYLATGKSKKALGVSEDTGFFMYPNQQCEVVGSSTVVLINAESMSYTNYHDISTNALIAAANLQISFLVHGNRFDLSNWQIIK